MSAVCRIVALICWDAHTHLFKYRDAALVPLNIVPIHFDAQSGTLRHRHVVIGVDVVQFVGEFGWIDERCGGGHEGMQRPSWY